MTDWNHRNTAYAIFFGGGAAAIACGMLLSCFLNTVPLILGVIALIWMLVLRYLIPRCRSCGSGYFSVLEIARFPVIIISWFGLHCFQCGERLP